MIAVRSGIALALLALAVVTALSREPVVLAGAAGLGFLLYCRKAAGLRQGALMLGPVLLFAGALAALAWWGGNPGWRLPLRTLGVFFLASAAARLAPWVDLFERGGTRSPLFPAILFLFFIRHFVGIFGAESRRVLISRRMAVPNKYGPGWFSSLKWALADVFGRSLARAERFYVSQAWRGVGE